MTAQIQPAGVWPLSGEIGAPFEPLGLPPVMRAELLDPTTGEILSLLREERPIPAAIQQQFRIRRKSGIAVQDDGHELHKIRKNDVTAAASIRFEVERIMKPFITARTARLDGVDISAGEAFGYVAAFTVRWTDLTTGQAVSTVVKAGG